MITEINKNLLKFDNAEVIIHQANCFHTMGTGIAKAIKEMYPEAYEADLRTDRGRPSKLGELSIAESPLAHHPYKRYIVNLYGQFYYGRGSRYTNYEAVAIGLSKVHKMFENKVLALPFKMGCNNAGGDWRVVRAIIESELSDNEVFICRV